MRNSVRNVEEALVEGAILTVIVVFLFLNSWRSTVITGLALPVSAISAFIAVHAFGFTLNTMSLLGLSLAIGILIDDAIVVRENIVRHVEMGEDHFTAAHTGTDEIGLAVTATTLSIMAVFVPIAFMQGISGQWFKPFALTIACAVLVSLFVSFSLDPMLSAYWPDPAIEEGQHRSWISRKLDTFNKWFDHQADRYKGVIAWALDHRTDMVAIAVGSFFASILIPAKGALAAAVLLVGVGVDHLDHVARSQQVARRRAPALVTFVVFFALALKTPELAKLGGGFIPDSDNSELSISIEAPPGSNIDYTHIKAEEIGRHRARAQGSRVHVHRRRQRDRLERGRRGEHLREDGSEEGAQHVAGRAQRDHSRRDREGRRAHRRVHFQRRLRGQPEADPGSDSRQRRERPERDRREDGGRDQEGEGRCGHRSLDEGSQARARRSAQSRTRRHARHHRRTARAVAASRVRRRAGGQLGRSDRQDSRRDGAARARSARQGERSAAASGDGLRADGTVNGAATPMNTGVQTVPLGQVATVQLTTGPAQIDHLNEDKVVDGRRESAGARAERGVGRHQQARSRRFRCRRACISRRVGR